MERVLTDVKMLWSNLYRDVRTLYIALAPPRESYFTYRLLATLSKYRDDLKDLDDLRSALLLKVRVKRGVKSSELAHSLIPISLNLVSRAVSRKPSYSVAVLAVKGFRNARLVAAAVVFSKSGSWVRGGVRPLVISLNPDVPPKVVKALAGRVSSRLWREVRDRVSTSGIRYVGVINALRLYPPIGVVALNTRAVGVEEIKAVVSDGSEYREVKVPVKVPTWGLDDLPPKIVEDVRVAIIDPIVRGLPFAAKGAFITGPPGVGKTVMAEALASALGLKVVELRPQTYRSMWYGATEKMLNAIFHQIIRRRRELALIIDDAEFISSRKYTIHEAHISEISTVLYHLQRPDRPFTILTANNPDLIDPAILRPGRIDVTIVIGYPDRGMRRKAVLRHLRMYSVNVSSGLVDRIVEVTKWYSLAEVDALIRLAAGKGGGSIGPQELEWARRRFNISISERASMQDYLRWWISKVQGVVIPYIPREGEI